MYIISKHHDYYDTALGHGIDKTLIFNRNNSFTLNGEEKPRIYNTLSVNQRINTYNYKDMKPRSYKDELAKMQLIVIGFCGKIYPIISANILIEYSPIGSTSKLIYGKDIYEVNEQCIKETGYSIDYYFNLIGGYNRKLAKSTEDYLRDFHEKFLKKWETVSPENKHIEGLFQKYNIPYFYLSDVKFDSCPVLKEFDFHKFIDPYTAFQEISMYLGGVLTRPEKETIEISDKDKRDSKGFDDRSFKHRTRKKSK